MELKIIHLMSTNIKFKKLIIIFLLLFFLTKTAYASEYIVTPCLNDQAGVSVSGEKVVKLEDTIEPYWHFLLWLAMMQIISAIDTLLLPTKLILIITGFRITEHTNMFDNQNRLSIYTYIKNRPGAYIGEIVEKIGLDRGGVRHHINILKAQGKIEAYKDGGKTKYFENNSTYHAEEMKVISALQNETNKRIILEIFNGKCNTNMALACEIEVSRATISWYMKNLKEIGIIKEIRDGKRILYKINPSYKNLIEKYG